MFLLNPWYFSCSMGHSPYQWTITFLPFLRRAKWLTNALLWEDFLHQVLQGCSKMGLRCYRCQLHFYRTICKPSANPGVSSALLTDLSYCLWSHNCKLAGRRWCSRSRDHGYLGHSSCNILILSGPFSRSVTYTPLLIWGWNAAVHVQLYDLVGQIMPVPDERIRSHGNQWAHQSAFSL